MNNEQSIFEVSESDFRKRIVDAVNGLIKRCDRQSRLITEMDENILKVQREVDELSSELDAVKTGVDALK